MRCLFAHRDARPSGSRLALATVAARASEPCYTSSSPVIPFALEKRLIRVLFSSSGQPTLISHGPCLRCLSSTIHGTTFCARRDLARLSFRSQRFWAFRGGRSKTPPILAPFSSCSAFPSRPDIHLVQSLAERTSAWEGNLDTLHLCNASCIPATPPASPPLENVCSRRLP